MRGASEAPAWLGQCVWAARRLGQCGPRGAWGSVGGARGAAGAPGAAVWGARRLGSSVGCEASGQQCGARGVWGSSVGREASGAAVWGAREAPRTIKKYTSEDPRSVAGHLLSLTGRSREFDETNLAW